MANYTEVEQTLQASGVITHYIIMATSVIVEKMDALKHTSVVQHLKNDGLNSQVIINHSHKSIKTLMETRQNNGKMNF